MKILLLLALPLLTPLGPAGPSGPQDEKRQKQEAEATRRIEEERAAHFRICDSNRNGWISFREAEFALLMDREEFRLYDTDQDGRIDPKEFETRYAKVLAQVGGLPVLRAELQKLLLEDAAPDLTPVKEEKPKSRFPAPADLLIAYDRDLDESIDRLELAHMFQMLSIDLSPDVVMETLDYNNTGLLELGEMGYLASSVASRIVPEDEGSLEMDDAEMFRRLYSSSRPRLLSEGAAPRPPLIPGPVTHFRRLDLDDNGFIDGEDLHLLLTPARIGVRPSAVLAALDRDGDGRLDELEFRACVGGKPRPR